MHHNLSNKSVATLINLRAHFRQTLKTKSLAAIQDPVKDTLRQFDEELSNRGISFKKQTHEKAKV